MLEEEVVVRYNSMIVPFYFSFSFSPGVGLRASTVHIFHSRRMAAVQS